VFLGGKNRGKENPQSMIKRLPPPPIQVIHPHIANPLIVCRALGVPARHHSHIVVPPMAEDLADSKADKLLSVSRVPPGSPLDPLRGSQIGPPHAAACEHLVQSPAPHQGQEIALDEGDVVGEVVGEDAHEQEEVLVGEALVGERVEQDQGPERGVLGGDGVDGAAAAAGRGGGEIAASLEGVDDVSGAAEGDFLWVGGSEEDGAVS